MPLSYPLTDKSLLKLYVGGQKRYGEVGYFFRAQVLGSPASLAMVSLCELPDPVMMQGSHDVLYVTTYASGSNLVVVEATDITAVVALLPFKQKPGFYSAVEDFGQDGAVDTRAGFSLEDGDSIQDV